MPPMSTEPSDALSTDVPAGEAASTGPAPESASGTSRQPPPAPAHSAPYGLPEDRPVVLDRRDGPYGEVVLRRHGDVLQIIANGTFLMDTSDGRSERLLVRAALDELRLGPHRAAPRLLIGGLGVGFSLAEAADEPEWGGVTVVEREEAVIAWHRDDGPLSPLTAAAARSPYAHRARGPRGVSAPRGRALRRALPGRRQRTGVDGHRGQRLALLTRRSRRVPGPAGTRRRPRRLVRTKLPDIPGSIAECRIP